MIETPMVGRSRTFRVPDRGVSMAGDYISIYRVPPPDVWDWVVLESVCSACGRWWDDGEPLAHERCLWSLGDGTRVVGRRILTIMATAGPRKGEIMRLV